MSGTHIAIHAARKRREERQREEESLTRYSPQELRAGWEFKILRSATGAFGKQEKLAAALEQESRRGWELVEKIDSERVRVRRPAAARQDDALLPDDIDPYRTRYGVGDWFKGLRLAAGIYLLMALGVLLLWMVSPLF